MDRHLSRHLHSHPKLTAIAKATSTGVPDPRLVCQTSVDTSLVLCILTVGSRREGCVLPPRARDVGVLRVDLGRFASVELFAEFLDLVA